MLATDTVKTILKREIQETAEATENLVANNIAEIIIIIIITLFTVD